MGTGRTQSRVRKRRLPHFKALPQVIEAAAEASRGWHPHGSQRGEEQRGVGLVAWHGMDNSCPPLGVPPGNLVPSQNSHVLV